MRTRAATVEVLPRLLLALTVVTGIVDAASYLKLGHVFVANMTGNVVFLGFAVPGAQGLSIPASLAALAAFLVGGVAGGSIGRRWDRDRMRALRASVAIQAVAVTGAAVLAGIVGTPALRMRSILPASMRRCKRRRPATEGGKARDEQCLIPVPRR